MDGCVRDVPFGCAPSQPGFPWQFPVGVEAGTGRVWETTLYPTGWKLSRLALPPGSGALQVGQLCPFVDLACSAKQVRQNA